MSVPGSWQHFNNTNSREDVKFAGEVTGRFNGLCLQKILYMYLLAANRRCKEARSTQYIPLHSRGLFRCIICPYVKSIMTHSMFLQVGSVLVDAHHTEQIKKKEEGLDQC